MPIMLSTLSIIDTWAGIELLLRRDRFRSRSEQFPPAF